MRCAFLTFLNHFTFTNLETSIKFLLINRKAEIKKVNDYF